MPAHFSDVRRNAVPRWRPARAAVRLGLVHAARVVRIAKKLETKDLVELRLDWELHNGVAHASDLVGAAVAVRSPDLAIDAAHYLLNNGRSGPAARSIAAACVAMSTGFEMSNDPILLTASDSHERINRLRGRVRQFARDPLAWLDLAREYTVIGLLEQAERPVLTAMSLASQDRLILRSAARFFLHSGDKPFAQKLLLNSGLTRHDPWIAAAEVAVASAGRRQPQSVRHGRELIASGRFSPFHLSELASQICTLEFEASGRGRVKKFMDIALVQPTENALAQVAWVARRTSNHVDHQKLLAAPNSFEAQAWDEYIHADWDGALDAASMWLLDEPFATRPAVFGSFMSGTTGNFAVSAQFAKTGLQANPGDLILANNLAFALGNLGRVEEAVKMLNAAMQRSPEHESRETVIATAGFLEYKLGNHLNGRTLYLRAIKDLMRKKQTRNAAIATLYFAREEFPVDHAYASELVRRAQDLMKELKDVDLMICESILNKTVRPVQRTYLQS